VEKRGKRGFFKKEVKICGRISTNNKTEGRLPTLNVSCGGKTKTRWLIGGKREKGRGTSSPEKEE